MKIRIFGFVLVAMLWGGPARAEVVCPVPFYNVNTNAVEVAFIRDNYRELFMGRNPDGTRSLVYKITEANGMFTSGADTWSAPMWDYNRIEQWAWNPRSKVFVGLGNDVASRDMVELGIVSLVDRDIYILIPGLTGSDKIGLRLEILYDESGNIASIESQCGSFSSVWDELFSLQDEHPELPFLSGSPEGEQVDFEPHQLCVGGRIVANNNYSCRTPKKFPALKPSRGLSLSAQNEIKPVLEAFRAAIAGETSASRARSKYQTMQKLLSGSKRLIHSADLVKYNAVQYFVGKGTGKSVKLSTLRALAVQLQPYISILGN